jgi:periplasmic divalent cation tolerance protein
VTTVLITAPPDAASELARTLVEERLAACVNRLPVESTYRWEGAIHEEREVLLLAKTADERYEALVERVRAVHPYEVPAIERFDEDDVLESYAAWRDEAVEPER